MFEDFIKSCPINNLEKVSRKRINTNNNAVWARIAQIDTENGVKISEKRRRKPLNIVFAAAILILVSFLTGSYVVKLVTVGYTMDDIISELKTGKYYLETTDGLDTECFIEVFESNKIQFVGVEKKSLPDDTCAYDWNTEPVEYRLSDKVPFIAVYSGHSLYDPEQIGIQYLDSNTLYTTINTEGHENAKDYSSDEEKEYRRLQNNDTYAIAHFVYMDTE